MQQRWGQGVPGATYKGDTVSNIADRIIAIIGALGCAYFVVEYIVRVTP